MGHRPEIPAGGSLRSILNGRDEDPRNPRRRREYVQQLYGIPGLPTAKNIIGGLNTQNITGYQSYGRDYTSPQWQNPFVLNPKINFSKILGSHTLKLGYEFQSISTNINDFNPAYGQDIYGGQFSNPTPTKSNTVYNLVDFLYGARSTYQLTNQADANLEQRMDFTYLQDDFKVSRKLTLNLGVRYEFATPQYELNNRQANYDPSTNSLVYAANGSMANRALVDPRYTGFAPRLGLAYSLTPKMVVRSGYGISYLQFERQGGDSYLAYNGPYVVNAQITQSPSQGLCTASSAPHKLLSSDHDGHSRRLRFTGELLHREHQNGVHPKRYSDAIRSKLASHNSAGAGEERDARPRLCRESQRRTLGHRRP
jgi:hypothetical protein